MFLSLIGLAGMLGGIIFSLPCLWGVFAVMIVSLFLGAIPWLCGVYEFTTNRAGKNIPSIVRMVILVIGIAIVFFLTLVVAQSLSEPFRQ